MHFYQILRRFTLRIGGFHDDDVDARRASQVFMCNGKNFCTYFLRLTKESAVSDLGCPVVSRLTCVEILSSTVCIFCAILNDVISHMRKDYPAPRGFRSSLSIGKRIFKDYRLVFIVVQGSLSESEQVCDTKTERKSGYPRRLVWLISKCLRLINPSSPWPPVLVFQNPNCVPTKALYN